MVRSPPNVIYRAQSANRNLPSAVLKTQSAMNAKCCPRSEICGSRALSANHVTTAKKRSAPAMVSNPQSTTRGPREQSSDAKHAQSSATAGTCFVRVHASHERCVCTQTPSHTRARSIACGRNPKLRSDCVYVRPRYACKDMDTDMCIDASKYLDA